MEERSPTHRTPSPPLLVGPGGVRFEVAIDARTYIFEAESPALSAPGRTVGVRVLGSGLGLVTFGLLLGAWFGNRERSRAFALGLFRRHSFRLFLAFLTLSALSLFFFQTLVRDFVAQRLVSETETEARRIAAIARKSLGDLSAFQEAEVPGPLAISDAAISWVAALVSNDLELFRRIGVNSWPPTCARTWTRAFYRGSLPPMPTAGWSSMMRT
jgi:hypothetical protein